MTVIPEKAKHLFALEDCTFTTISGHEGGRNRIVTVSRNGKEQYVLRISALGDRSEEDYLAETEFVRFLAENGAPVSDVLPSIQGKLVERVEADGKPANIFQEDIAKKFRKNRHRKTHSKQTCSKCFCKQVE